MPVSQVQFDAIFRENAQLRLVNGQLQDDVALLEAEASSLRQRVQSLEALRWEAERRPPK